MSLDVGGHRRLRRHLLSEAQPAEGAIGLRVGQMEVQLTIAEAVHLLEQQRAEDLLGRHALGPRGALGIRREVLPDQLQDPRMFVEQIREGLQLFGMVQIEPREREVRLRTASFAHSSLDFLRLSPLRSVF